MIISIASGKGGTGKTFIATNLAHVIRKESSYIDCDVEAPNGHLFLKPEITQQSTERVFIPEVNQAVCTLCRKCIELCQFNALIQLKDEVLVFPELCHSCLGCQRICPEDAIQNGKRELGTLYFGKSGHVHFASGRLRIGEAMAPPLIERLKSQIIEKDPQKIFFIDSPPGTACPAVTAVKHSDYVVLVTEPTPFGFHDLKLAAEMLQTMQLPFGIIINRSDVGNDEVRQYCEACQWSVLGTFVHDKNVAEAYAQGQLITEVDKEYGIKFQQLAETIFANVRIAMQEAA